MPKSFRELLAESLGISTEELFGQDQDVGEVGRAIEGISGRVLDDPNASNDQTAGVLANLPNAFPGDGLTGARQGLAGALEATLRKAFDLEDIENQRFAESKDFLLSEFDKMNAGFEERNARQDRLLFSGAADKFGAEAAAGLSNLRTGIGARGVNPNSGAAAALAGNIGLRQQGQLMGAKRDITIDSMRRRDARELDRFRSAFGLGEFMNQGDSEIGLAALGSLTSARFQQEMNESNQREARLARKQAGKNALLGGVGSVVGAFL